MTRRAGNKPWKHSAEPMDREDQHEVVRAAMRGAMGDTPAGPDHWPDCGCDGTAADHYSWHVYVRLEEADVLLPVVTPA